jgi:2-oxo-4-hydroxy-4-carboxy-5-ureidoimidazoline decarboxylase
VTLDLLNSLSAKKAQTEFFRCCGSTRWARQMTERRPFHNEAELSRVAEELWNILTPHDWKEAFSQHPRIGDLEQLRAKFAHANRWADAEQAGALGASDDVLSRLAEGNRLYETKFGFIFIVCATGKRAEEMLGMLEQRLNNTPVRELRIAADEQCKITRIRLEKLLQERR